MPAQHTHVEGGLDGVCIWKDRGSPHQAPWCGLRSADSLCCVSWRFCSQAFSSGFRKCALAGLGASTNCSHGKTLWAAKLGQAFHDQCTTARMRASSRREGLQVAYFPRKIQHGDALMNPFTKVLPDLNARVYRCRIVWHPETMSGRCSFMSPAQDLTTIAESCRQRTGSQPHGRDNASKGYRALQGSPGRELTLRMIP